VGPAGILRDQQLVRTEEDGFLGQHEGPWTWVCLWVLACVVGCGW
jgi:hypothetical protein